MTTMFLSSLLFGACYPTQVGKNPHTSPAKLAAQPPAAVIPVVSCSDGADLRNSYNRKLLVTEVIPALWQYMQGKDSPRLWNVRKVRPICLQLSKARQPWTVSPFGLKLLRKQAPKASSYLVTTLAIAQLCNGDRVFWRQDSARQNCIETSKVEFVSYWIARDGTVLWQNQASCGGHEHFGTVYCGQFPGKMHRSLQTLFFGLPRNALPPRSAVESPVTSEP